MYLDFQYDTRTKGTDGFETSDWTSKAKRYATVEMLKGAERWTAQAFLGSNPLRIRVRYDGLIKGVVTNPDRWRILRDSDDTVYEIVSAVNEGLRDRWIIIDAMVGSAVQDG